jgi:ornithine carbamoyltransferase
VAGPTHFIDGTELTAADLAGLIDRADELKRTRGDGAGASLRGKSIALLFERPSTRTRVSFEVGVSELGGHPIVLRSDELQLSRGEPVRDTAIVLSRYVDGIVARLSDHRLIEEIAAHAEVPVVNALTPLHHPCQALADLLTLEERFGALEGVRLAYVGDGNNVCNSLLLVGSRAGVQVAVATPPELSPAEEVLRAAPDGIELSDDPRRAVAGAHAVYTDTWVSMGDEAGAVERRALLSPYQVNEKLLAAARDDAVVMHCLPAHPGEEITAELLYGERSVAWDQAENRLHAQKALLELLLAS